MKSKSDPRSHPRRASASRKRGADAKRDSKALAKVSVAKVPLAKVPVAKSGVLRKPAAVTKSGEPALGTKIRKPASAKSSRTKPAVRKLERFEAQALAAGVDQPGGRRATPAGKKPRQSKPAMRKAKFDVGQVVRHKHYPFRGIVFDIDPVFASTEDWWLSIPAEVRPKKNQPFYHLLAENDETEYIAYVSEQNLLPDNSGNPIRHPQLAEFFIDNGDGTYRAVFMSRH